MRSRIINEKVLIDIHFFLSKGGMSVSASQSLEGSQIGGSSLGRGSVGRNLSRGSAASNVSFGKPSTSTLTSLAGIALLAFSIDHVKEREREKWYGEEAFMGYDFSRVPDRYWEFP